MRLHAPAHSETETTKCYNITIINVNFPGKRIYALQQKKQENLSTKIKEHNSKEHTFKPNIRTYNESVVLQHKHSWKSKLSTYIRLQLTLLGPLLLKYTHSEMYRVNFCLFLVWKQKQPITH
jgi:hypothetical protein